MKKKKTISVHPGYVEDYITLVFHHGGFFATQPRLMYVGGRINRKGNIDVDTISIPDIVSFYKDFGGEDFKRMMWLEPGKDLDDGLRPVDSDEDIRLLLSHILKDSELHLYFTHTDNDFSNQQVDNASIHGGLSVLDECDFTESEEAAIDAAISRFSQQVDQEVIPARKTLIEDTDMDVRKRADEDVGESRGQAAIQEGENSDDDDDQGDDSEEIGGDEQGDDSEDSGDDEQGEGSEDSEDEAYKPESIEESESNDEDDLYVEEEFAGTSQQGIKQRKKKWRLHYTGNFQQGLFVENTQDNQHTAHNHGTQQSAQTFQIEEGPESSTVNPEGYLTEEFESLKGSDDDEEEKKPPEFNQAAPYGQVHLEIGMLFPTLDMFKEVVKDFTISIGRPVFLKKNDKKRCKYVCEKGCPWVIICSKSEVYGCFRIKTFYPTHNCSRKLKNHNADRKWVTKKLVEKLWSTPNLTGTEAMKYISEQFQVQVVEMMIYRALRKAKEVVEGSEREQYAKLRDYVLELSTSNPGSTLQLGCDRPDFTFPPKFEKLYISFAACKRGLLSGCRPLIGLDGCFLKGYYGGTLLAAVTQDPNNAFYVISFAIVEQETKDTWSFFLTRLFEDIGNPTTQGWEFISDMQKGLLPAMQELAPGTRHRFCVKHLEANLWKQWRNKDLRFKLWACAKSKTVNEFERNYGQLRGINADAWNYLNRFPMQTWSRAGLTEFTKNPALLNNMCEQFNATIVKYRGKPILSMLEEIRLYMMRKMNESRNQIAKYKGPITPFAQRKLEQSKKDSNNWIPLWAGDSDAAKYQVHHMHRSADKYAVDLKELTCSCREWDVSGIPCMHAVACMGHNNLIPEEYVSHYYSKQTWEAIYTPYIEPVRGEDRWAKSNLEAVVPPSYNRGGGRPKKKRRRTNDLPNNPYKAKRTYKEMTCGKCGQKGHNKRFCKGTAIKEKKNGKNVGTPRQSQGDSSATNEGTVGSQTKAKKTPTSQLVSVLDRTSPSIAGTVGSQTKAKKTSTSKLVSVPVKNSRALQMSSTTSAPVVASTLPLEVENRSALMPPPEGPLAKRPTAFSSGAITAPMRPVRAKQAVVRPPFKPPGVSSLPRVDMQPGKIPSPSFQWRGQPCVTSQTLQAASKITRSRASILLKASVGNKSSKVSNTTDSEETGGGNVN